MRLLMVLILSTIGIACYRDHGLGAARCEALPDAEPVVFVAGPQRACPEGGVTLDEPLVTREDRATLGAFVIDPRPVASETSHARVAADLDAFEASTELGEDTAGGIFFPSRLPGAIDRVLQLRVDDETAARIESGDYHDWDCLNAHYEVTAVEVAPAIAIGEGREVVVVLGGTLAVELLYDEYLTLPGVLGRRSDSPGIGSASAYCVLPEGERLHYVVAHLYGDCISGCTESDCYYFVTDAAGSIEARDSWLDLESEPPCWADLCDPFDPLHRR